MTYTDLYEAISFLIASDSEIKYDVLLLTIIDKKKTADSIYDYHN